MECTRLAVLLTAAFGFVCAPGFAAQPKVLFTTLHSFSVYTNGTAPNAPLVEGQDGALYGTTYSGGVNGGNGTIFKISTNGIFTHLYSFSDYDGKYPSGKLVIGRDGCFYGTTALGGTNSKSEYSGDILLGGTVFKISADGKFQCLHCFSLTDGCTPNGLSLGSDGFLYGTTQQGGVSFAGNVFRIGTNGGLTVIHTFTGGLDGGNPAAGLVQMPDGSFFGTTQNGGTNSCGTIFQITTNGVLTVLYSFTGGADGSAPGAALCLGKDGACYGSTTSGANGNGTLFKITASGAFATLYSFPGGYSGSHPNSALVQTLDGSFYGTCVDNAFANGAFFKFTALGEFTNLVSFSSVPTGLLLASNGLLFGTTYDGGTGGGNGTVFEATTNGVLATLYSFAGVNDGRFPFGTLLKIEDGNLYGTTSAGGSNNATGNGTVFRIATNGDFTLMFDYFNNPAEYGFSSYGGLVEGADGNLYGTGAFGGGGSIFKITLGGVLTSLHLFNFLDVSYGTNAGCFPEAALTLANDGNFYGTTREGGTNLIFAGGGGTVYRISPYGIFTSLHSFSGPDGSSPEAPLVQGSDGYLYGTTWYGGASDYGTVFKIATNGTFTTLHSFTGHDGAGPWSKLIEGADGNLYGTTSRGGAYFTPLNPGYGTVFMITPNGALTSLHSFSGNDGACPRAELIQAADGTFYGTTYGTNSDYFGLNNFGTVFCMTTNGVVTTLYSFSGDSDGGNPGAGLIQGQDGALYGTTSSGGLGGNGTIFRVLFTPELNIQFDTANSVLSWPTSVGGVSYAGYKLQSSANLVSPVWTNVLVQPTSANGVFSVSIPVSGAQQFFRLIQH